MNIVIDLQKEREKKGLSQEQLANLIGVKRQALSGIERGLSLPSVENAKKLASVLDLKWSDFFEESKSEVSQ